MKFLEEERLRIFYLDSGNSLIHEKEIPGTVDSVRLDPRKIFGEAISKNASAVIIAHNHPSGEDEATRPDIEATEELMEAGEKLDMDLLDHIIVGDGVSSMKASSPVNFG